MPQFVLHQNDNFQGWLCTRVTRVHLNLLDSDIQDTTIKEWKKFVTEKVSEACLLALGADNFSKTKTKYIIFESLEIREYLKQNVNPS